MSYNQVGQLPSHARASGCGCGSAREEYQYSKPSLRHGTGPIYAAGLAGGDVRSRGCHFPPPPARRVYCTPAPFTSACGQTNFRLTDAYGYSRPAMGYHGY